MASPVGGALLGVGGLGVVAAAGYRLLGDARETTVTGDAAGEEPAADSEQATTTTADEEFEGDPADVLDDAEESAASAQEARGSGDYEAATAALDAAIERLEQLAARDADVDADLDSRLAELRQRRRDLEAEQSTVADLQERLATAEQRLATADEAYDDGDGVVARLRYRQARDIYADVRTRLQQEDLEDITVTAGDHEFDGVADIDQRHQTAVDGFELTN